MTDASGAAQTSRNRHDRAWRRRRPNVTAIMTGAPPMRPAARYRGSDRTRPTCRGAGLRGRHGARPPHGNAARRSICACTTSADTRAMTRPPARTAGTDPTARDPDGPAGRPAGPSLHRVRRTRSPSRCPVTTARGRHPVRARGRTALVWARAEGSCRPSAAGSASESTAGRARTARRVRWMPPASRSRADPSRRRTPSRSSPSIPPSTRRYCVLLRCRYGWRAVVIGL